jgi:hypothetical protein
VQGVSDALQRPPEAFTFLKETRAAQVTLQKEGVLKENSSWATRKRGVYRKGKELNQG